MSSISRSGTSSAAVPVRKTSSASASSARATSRSTPRSRGRARSGSRDLRLMPSRMLAVWPGVTITPSRDHEHVLAGALADVALVVEQDRLLVAGLDRLDLGQHRVQVLPGGLRVRDQRVRRDAPVGRHARAHAVLLALLAEVGPPLPDGDHRLDRVVERVEAHRPVAAVDERPDVAALEAVAAISSCVASRSCSCVNGQVHVVELGRLLEPVEVVVRGGRSPGPCRSRRRGCPRRRRCRSGGRGSVRVPSRPPRRRTPRSAR